MPRPSRRHIPDDQLDRLRAAHQAQLDALAARSVLAERLAVLEADVAAGRSELLAADVRLAGLVGVETAAAMTGTPASELRRAMRGAA